MNRYAAAMLAGLAACAQAPTQAPIVQNDSVVPGTLGVIVREQHADLVVSAVAQAAAGAGVRVGDVVVRYNGEAVAGPRHFYRLVVDSPPGSTARLEVRREGELRTLEVPVRELDLMPRV